MRKWIKLSQDKWAKFNFKKEKINEGNWRTRISIKEIKNEKKRQKEEEEKKKKNY